MTTPLRLNPDLAAWALAAWALAAWALAAWALAAWALAAGAASFGRPRRPSQGDQVMRIRSSVDGFAEQSTIDASPSPGLTQTSWSNETFQNAACRESGTAATFDRSDSSRGDSSAFG